MVETLKHLFGFCGEGHPSLLMGFGLTQLALFKNQFIFACKYFGRCLKNCILLFWR